MFGGLRAFGISQSLLALDGNHGQANGNVMEGKQNKKEKKKKINKFFIP
jgi:hypothetical protein